MQININIQRVIGDIRTKSHLELANVADPTVRYKIEAGTEKIGEIKRDLASAVSSVQNECFRYISGTAMDVATDEISPDSEIVFDLVGGSRRFDGKEIAIAQKIHEILVDLTLQKYYISVSEANLSKAHEKQAMAGIIELKILLCQKRPPRIIEP